MIAQTNCELRFRLQSLILRTTFEYVLDILNTSGLGNSGNVEQITCLRVSKLVINPCFSKGKFWCHWWRVRIPKLSKWTTMEILTHPTTWRISCPEIRKTLIDKDVLPLKIIYKNMRVRQWLLTIIMHSQELKLDNSNANWRGISD